MKLLILIKELALLKDFEKQDVVLVEALRTKRAEKAKLVTQAEELNAKLSPLIEAMSGAMKQSRELDEEFKKLIGDSNPHAEQLAKVFDRAPKRNKVCFRTSVYLSP